MDIGAVVMRLYPDADPSDFSVSQEPGEQPKITRWNEATLGPRPTESQLRDAWLPALKEQKIVEIRRRVVSEADAVMPVWEFIYITRARIADSRTTTLEAIAKKGRDMETWINDPARTEAQLQTVSWDMWR